MHNLKGYDSHLIIKYACEINNQIGNRKIYGILNCNEKLMALSIGDLQFTDSFKFMAPSLDSLGSHLSDKEDMFENFTQMKCLFPDQMDLLCKKQIIALRMGG